MSRTKWDKRLIGTWKSDRRRTFRHWKPKAGCPPETFQKLKSLFGKLTVRWTRGKVYCVFDEPLSVRTYEVLDSDCLSVFVRFNEPFLGGYLQQIYFEDDDCYYLLAGNIVEYFRRIA